MLYDSTSFMDEELERKNENQGARAGVRDPSVNLHITDAHSDQEDIYFEILIFIWENYS